MTQLTADELMRILHVALEELRQDVDSDMTAAKVLCLTTTYSHPGVRQADLKNYISGGISPSSSSRYLLDWGIGHPDKGGKPLKGMDFVSQVPNPTHRRENVLYVTGQGQAYIASLTERVNKALKKLTERSIKSA